MSRTGEAAVMSECKKVRVLVVDDSALIRSIFEQVLPMNRAPLEVVGTAANGKDAIRLNRELRPDLITLDIEMPVMGGIEAVKRIMSERPVPIIVVSGTVDAANSFQALQHGALEVMRKPEIMSFNDPGFYVPFQNKLVALARVDVGAKRRALGRSFAKETDGSKGAFRMLVLGASTGGPAAVSEILRRLPAGFPVGIAMVQHIQAGFGSGYAAWLNSDCSLDVRMARDGDTVSPGEIVIAPDDNHLLFENGKLRVDDGGEVLNQKPSVDVLFRSAAAAYGTGLIGVLLTGMGTDGAEGCHRIVSRGGYTVVQDESTSVVFGMPKAAIEAGGASTVLPLSAIADTLIDLTAHD